MANHRNNKKEAKRSGATYSKIKNVKKGNEGYLGATIVSAWNSSKSRGLITATVSPYSGSTKYTSPTTGNEYQTMIAKVLYHNTGVEMIIPCSMNVKTRVIGLSKLGMCISPNGKGTTSSGKRVTGYFGTFKQ
ncbi:hypothetical protein A9Q86_02205 [Flavobacteriales bacterium 33_180_T64]|nr:hypothetical protein A9Q86_02205 [Flavobacteriales bacterium 33_180_T64]